MKNQKKQKRGDKARFFAGLKYFEIGDFTKSKEILERVVELDPNYSMAWAFLAWTHALGVRYGWSPFKTDTDITYTGLDEGEHVFSVKAMNEAGKEDETPATRSFIILIRIT